MWLSGRGEERRQRNVEESWLEKGGNRDLKRIGREERLRKRR